MDKYIYLSMIPESLVVSMLPPAEFGAYLAAGTCKRPHGEAIFFQLNDFKSDHFDLSAVDQRCVPHPDGQPKHSVYLGVYRVLEHVPLDALGSLWLITAHGRGLELKMGQAPEESDEKHHLYQELCPVHPLIASTLSPTNFCRFITDPGKPISVPKICFVDLETGDLEDKQSPDWLTDLPYRSLDHIRACLEELGPKKQTKTVDRISRQTLLYRSVKNGFYVGDNQKVLFYPYPKRRELEREYYAWWHCANDSEVVC